MDDGLPVLGWNEWFDDAWQELGAPGAPGPRGAASTAAGARSSAGPRASAGCATSRADVAVGDWVVPSADGERVEHVLERRSAFVRRASFEGARAESDTLAANIDVVFITHSVGSPPNQRRLERELVLAFDSGAEPVVVLTKADLVDDADAASAGGRSSRSASACRSC